MTCQINQNGKELQVTYNFFQKTKWTSINRSILVWSFRLQLISRHIKHLCMRYLLIGIPLFLLFSSCNEQTDDHLSCSSTQQVTSTSIDSLLGTYLGTYRFKEIRSYSADQIVIDPDQVLHIQPAVHKDLAVDFLNTTTELCFTFEDSDSMIFQYNETDYCCSTLDCSLTIYKLSKQIRYRYYKTYTASGHFSATEQLFYD